MTKVCSKCGEEKELCEFGKLTRHKDGLNPHCKLCERAYRVLLNRGENSIATNARHVRWNTQRREEAELLLSPNRTCQDCGATESKGSTKYLHFHHQNGDGHRETKKWWIQASRENPSCFVKNTRLLCVQCHSEAHRLEKHVSEVANLEQIIAFQRIQLVNANPNRGIPWV